MKKAAGTRNARLGRRTGIARTSKRRAGISAADWRRFLREWERRIHARDQWCQRCGSTEWLQCHHVYTKRLQRLRCDPRNGVLLCRGCHFWWHNLAQGGEQWAWIEGLFGSERMDHLRAVYANDRFKVTRDYVCGLLEIPS